MPLPPTAPRKRMHTRKIEIHGFEREDGLWEIDAHLKDTKSYDFPNQFRGTIQAGEPVHDMFLRMTVNDALIIQEVQAISEGTPFAICPEATAAYGRLKGLRIAAGWGWQLKERIGGTKGCTHLSALLNEAATVAFQTIFPIRHRGKPSEQAGAKPELLNSCYALASERDVVKAHWPDFYIPVREAQIPAQRPWTVPWKGLNRLRRSMTGIRMAVFRRRNPEIDDDEGPKGRRQGRFVPPCIHFGADLMHRPSFPATDLLERLPHAGLEPHARPMAGNRDIPINQGAYHSPTPCARFLQAHNFRLPIYDQTPQVNGVTICIITIVNCIKKR